MNSGMVPVTILLVPVVAASLLGFLYGPAVQALNPGNEIMTASDHTLQADTFSLVGSVGSQIPSGGELPNIVTGSWGLDVQGGNVSIFLADLSMINANGSGYKTIMLSNLTTNGIEMHENGTATIAGTVDVAVNGTHVSAAEATITVAKLRAITIMVDPENVTDTFAGSPVYGIADQPELEAASLPTEQETGMSMDNFTEKFSLPELPNPFR